MGNNIDFDGKCFNWKDASDFNALIKDYLSHKLEVHCRLVNRYRTSQCMQGNNLEYGCVIALKDVLKKMGKVYDIKFRFENGYYSIIDFYEFPRKSRADERDFEE